MKFSQAMQQTVVLLAAVVAFFCLFPNQGDLRLSPDSEEYSLFADALLSGALFQKMPIEEFPRALVRRTPGYPLALAAGKQLTSSDRHAVYLVHSAIAFTTLISVPLLLKAAAPVWVTAPTVLLAFWKMRAYFHWGITEWMAFALLLFVFALSVRYGDRSTGRRLAILGVVCALAILTRPALIFLAALPPVLVVLAPVGTRRKQLVIAGLSLLAVPLWMGFNQWRLGEFSVTPFAGWNVFGVASLIGSAQPEPGDSPQVVDWIHRINARKQPPPGTPFDIEIAEPALRRTYAFNTGRVAEEACRDTDCDRVAFNKFLLVYSVRSIRGNLPSYLSYVARGVTALRRGSAVLFTAFAIAIFWLVRRGSRTGLVVGLLVVLCVHLAHLLLCAGIEVVIPRYWALTFEPVLAGAIIAASVLLLDFVHRLPSSRASGLSPAP